jgi:hypothetical protein
MPPPRKSVPALQAADNLLLAKEVVSNAVSSHSLAVTWLPKPMAGEAGSGVHMHFSLWRVCVRALCVVSREVQPENVRGATKLSVPYPCFVLLKGYNMHTRQCDIAESVSPA